MVGLTVSMSQGRQPPLTHQRGRTESAAPVGSMLWFGDSCSVAPLRDRYLSKLIDIRVVPFLRKRRKLEMSTGLFQAQSKIETPTGFSREADSLATILGS